RAAVAPELPVQLRPVRRVPQRLVAQRDGVVVETGLRVPVRSLFVAPHGVHVPPAAEVQIADPVEKLEVRPARPLLREAEHLLVGLDRLVPLLPLFVEASLLLQPGDRLHRSSTSPHVRATTCSRTRRVRIRSSAAPESLSRLAAAVSSSSSGSIPITSVSTIRPPMAATCDSI